MMQFSREDAESSRTGNDPSPEHRHPPAALIRMALARARVLGIRVIGPPGSGKTELIESTLKRLAAPRRVAVIVVNPAPARDVVRLQNLCGFVASVDAAIPTAQAIWHIISKLKLESFESLIIEAAGGLAPLQDLGQDATVAVFATSGGDDKAAEYHTLLSAASAVVLTKTDLQSLVRFDSKLFRNDVQSINESADLHEVSARTGTGISAWIAWLEQRHLAKRRHHENQDPDAPATDDYFG